MNDGAVRRIASEWHGGQRSPLYALASTGTITDAVECEIETCIRTCEMKFVNELTELLTYVRHNGERGPVSGWSSLWSEGSIWEDDSE